MNGTNFSGMWLQPAYAVSLHLQGKGGGGGGELFYPKVRVYLVLVQCCD